MDPMVHDMPALFAQLGLPNDADSLRRFIDSHTLRDGMALADAPFWNASQASFLRESLRDDAAWSETIDQLDVLLRQ
ncbi:DUF2789 domain-containing protein [Aeromonas bivalvium]|uniref:DUF2789 domain-containing protein n=1 Tax=Aeromonas bivalvium TaxID=440079 RepID=UPI00370BF58B